MDRGRDRLTREAPPRLAHMGLNGTLGGAQNVHRKGPQIPPRLKPYIATLPAREKEATGRGLAQARGAEGRNHGRQATAIRYEGARSDHSCSSADAWGLWGLRRRRPRRWGAHITGRHPPPAGMDSHGSG